ncbi:MAG: FIST C-terminal domain-containing protein [Treponema sp.]|jgi:hypothetical protein|nr:FIST C-terminal domain-containing protein [Treponema sp.]
MSIKVARRSSGDFAGLIKEIEQPQVKAVIYFFSVEYERLEVHRALKRAFPQASCIGASMLGGWCTGGAVEKGLVAMSLSSDEVAEAFIALQEGVKQDPALAARKLIEDLKRKSGHRTFDPNSYLGILFFDGLCYGEEIVRRFTFEKGFNLNLVGGAAADEFTFTKTLVSADETCSADGVAVLLMKMNIPFYCNHYVHCIPTATSFVITKADPVKRIVWEIEGQEAATYYAKATGLASPDAITMAHLAQNPLGIVMGDTVYVRSQVGPIEGGGLQFYCYLDEQTRVHLLRRGDIIAHAQKTLEDVGRYLPNVQGALLFNCAFRYLELQELKKVSDFNRVFEHLSFAGFNTYGEEFVTHHNQTLTAVFFGG